MQRTLSRALARLAAVALAGAALAAPPAGAAQAEPGVVAQVRSFAATTGLSYAAAQQYFALTHAVGDLQARGVAEYPATFAGVWRTPSDGGLVHLAFTRDAAAFAARLTARFPRRDLVRVTTARTSLRALDALAVRVVADHTTLRQVAASAVSVDVTTGRVVVETAGALSRARDVLSARFAGAPVTVRAGAPVAPMAAACQRALCPLNAMGGIELLGTVGSDVYACTSGFGATKVSTGAPALVTAGHCFPSGGVAFNGGVPIGRVGARAWPGGDAEEIDQLPVYASSNEVYWNEPGLYLFVRGAVGHTVSEAVGAPVCRTGITTQNQCGTIQALNVTVTYVTGETVSGLTRTTACVQPGDSGGPYMSGTDAYGITSGGTVGLCGAGTTSLYYPVPRIESAIGVRINT
jgi:streptogrisin C